MSANTYDELDPYLECIWCGKSIHVAEYSSHPCPEKEKYYGKKSYEGEAPQTKEDRLRQEGSMNMLFSIRASIRDYPNGGCDIEIAESLDKIKRQGAVEALCELFDGAPYVDHGKRIMFASDIERRIAELKGESK